MSYVLIVMLTMSGVTTSYLKMTRDSVMCIMEADNIKQSMMGTPGEWTLRTRCVPVTGKLVAV